jgi:hypothetical protein
MCRPARIFLNISTPEHSANKEYSSSQRISAVDTKSQKEGREQGKKESEGGEPMMEALPAHG